MIRLQKLINVSFLLDSGDKSVQCGRKTDAFKIWFMLKVRGEDFISKRVDNAFKQAKLMETMIKIMIKSGMEMLQAVTTMMVIISVTMMLMIMMTMTMIKGGA